MANDQEGRIDLEVTPLTSDTLPSAIRGGEAHFLITKMWGGVDFAHRGSMARQGFTAAPDGALVFSIPCNADKLTMGDLKELMEKAMNVFSGSYEVFLHFGEEEDF